MTPKHEHEFVYTRALLNYNKEVTGLDFDCKTCDMSMFVQGKFSWHSDFDEYTLKEKDLDEAK